MIEVNNQAHGRAIAKSAGICFNPEADVTISRSSGGRLLGGVVYQGYTGESISIHVAGFSKNWLCRDLLWAAFDYPFRQLKCSKVFGTVKGNDTDTIDFDHKIGFNTCAKIPGVFPGGEDMIVLEMRREACRWLSLKPRSQRRGEVSKVGLEVVCTSAA